MFSVYPLKTKKQNLAQDTEPWYDNFYSFDNERCSFSKEKSELGTEGVNNSNDSFYYQPG